MIVDTIDNLDKYIGVNSLFKDVVDFIKNNDLNALESGKHYLKGNDLFVNVTTATGKTENDATYETHRRMLDIQIPLSAPETYGYMPLKDMPKADYNEAKDVTKYPGLMGGSLISRA